MIQNGVVTNRWKKVNPGKTVFTFAMGDEAFYDFLHENIAIESHPVSYVNDPAVIAQNDNVVSVNSTIEMDLTGACNSEYVNGHQFTSTGGQLDFVRGAYASKGGMSFIAFRSSIKDGKISKIVPRLSGPVTTPRTDVHYVVIENGAAKSKGAFIYRAGARLDGTCRPCRSRRINHSGQGIAFDLKARDIPTPKSVCVYVGASRPLLQNISVGPHMFSAHEPGDQGGRGEMKVMKGTDRRATC
jgi:Acetyl-CoA hydrolase/transferase C-terminal domain